MEAEIYKNFYDIVIIPPRNVRKYAIDLSKKIYPYNHKWYLGEAKFIPHISLYHIPVRPELFKKFIANLKRVLLCQRFGSLCMTNLETFPPHDGIYWTTDKPKWLQKLHLRILKNILPYFDWDYGAEKLWNINELTKGEKDSFKTYGTPMVERYFRPHVTLGKCPDIQQRKALIKKLYTPKLTFPVQSIYICELGTSFSCQSIIEKIDVN